MPQAHAPKYVALTLVTAVGQEIPVTGTSFTIGRQFDCHYRPDSVQISRRHTLLSHEPEGWFAEDMGSAMGTFHNQRPLTGRQRLADGDELMVADVKLRVRLR
ncbi:FHA domain-containing protein [Corallococcus exercitus]|uniref:FHA domain-containing protein n=1 Tax=Corallococcus exercitus TaxID=2316736 RepID=UPI0035D45AC0